MINPSSGTHSLPLISTPLFQGCRVILAADHAVGYQQRHRDVARKIGPRFALRMLEAVPMSLYYHPLV
jgi:hypothetical protein